MSEEVSLKGKAYLKGWIPYRIKTVLVFCICNSFYIGGSMDPY